MKSECGEEWCYQTNKDGYVVIDWGKNGGILRLLYGEDVNGEGIMYKNSGLCWGCYMVKAFECMKMVDCVVDDDEYLFFSIASFSLCSKYAIYEWMVLVWIPKALGFYFQAILFKIYFSIM